MMSERMKVLIAYDGSSSAQAALAELARAGLNVSSAIKEGDAMNLLIAEAESWGADSISQS